MLLAKALVIQTFLTCIQGRKGESSPSFSETIALWLGYPSSKKVRLLSSKLLLECLHNSEGAQIIFCQGQESEGGSNFTPTAHSLIALNANIQSH